MPPSWIVQSFVVLLCAIPAWLAIGFFDRNFHVKSDIFLFWYMLGILIALASFKIMSSSITIPSWKVVGAIMLIGLTIGAVSNILIFRAVANAPNPGLPLAITSTGSVGVFITALAFSRWAPNHFNPVKFDLLSFLGIVLAVIGVSLIVIRR
ncbi:MAG: Uncharacterized protein G01um1014107_356 [Parcubacteria group bacterium Gr01-1014_107]|nr:MAG: Uncharacterized protein G01um1014107_356 [Parcubacteria group bacterium Gr01-1014_107]